MIPTDLRPYAPLFREQTELRVQENRSTRVVLLNGDVVANDRDASGGVCSRVYQRGKWGFASAPEITDATVKNVILSATENASFLTAKGGGDAEDLPASAFSKDVDLRSEKPAKQQRELIDFLRALDAHLLDEYPFLASRTLGVQSLSMERTVLTSHGSHGYSRVPRTNIFLRLTVDREGAPVEMVKLLGGTGDLADTVTDPADYHEKIAETVEHLRNKAEGAYSEAGTADVVLHADLAGILAHEAIGHTTEADIVQGGSVAADYLGKEAASPLVTLVDFAHTALCEPTPIPIFVDDEGTQATDAVLIDRGVLKGYMHNRESARHFGVQPTGNARAYRFSDEPIVRMRNTALMPGESSLEEMIGSIDHGYYLMRAMNGQADSTSEFMFGIILGYEIRNGKLGHGLRDTTISGVAFDMLKTVSMVSTDMVWSNSGMCGKKQPIPVGMGGPAVKCRVNIGGR